MYINMNNLVKETKMGNIKNLRNLPIMLCLLNYQVHFFSLALFPPLLSSLTHSVIMPCLGKVHADDTGSDDSSESESENDTSKIDPDDPMASYLAGEKKKSKKKGSGGDKEEKKRRKEERRRKREEKERKRLIKELKGKEGKGKGVKRERRDEDDEGVLSRDSLRREERGGRDGRHERDERIRERSPKLERRSPDTFSSRREGPNGRDGREEPRRRDRDVSPVRRSNGHDSGPGGGYEARRNGDGRRDDRNGGRYDDRRRDDRDNSYSRRDRP
jgi:RNA-binding motif X-linked protein 2